jgi:hypothetical protein
VIFERPGIDHAKHSSASAAPGARCASIEVSFLRTSCSLV